MTAAVAGHVIPDAPEVDPTALATPTSILVSNAPARSEAWFRQRRAGITATDVVAVMHPNKWNNAITVWADKLGRGRDDDAGEAAYWGTVHEPAIARRWAELNGTDVREIGTLAYLHNPRHLASLDRLPVRCPDGDGPCGLECKSRSEWKAGSWREDVPDEEYVQTQWQNHVTGYGHQHLAVLFGGNRLKWYRVDRDEADIEVFVHRADVLWQQVESAAANPENREEHRPHVDPSADLLETLRALYPSREGQVVLPADDLRTLIARYHQAKEASAAANKVAKKAKDALAAATAALVVELGDAEAAFAEGDDLAPVLEFREFGRKGYSVGPTSWREIRVNKAWLPGPGPLNPAAPAADEPSVSFTLQEATA